MPLLDGSLSPDKLIAFVSQSELPSPLQIGYSHELLVSISFFIRYFTLTYSLQPLIDHHLALFCIQ